MSNIRRFLQRLGHAFRPDRAEADLQREVASHLALLEDEYRRRGMSPEQVHTEARKAIGGAEQAKIRHRDARSFLWLDELFADVRQAWRTVIRNRRSSLAAMLILTTVGVVTTLTLGIADTVLFRALPYHDPDRVHVVMMTTDDAMDQRYTRVSNRVLQLFAEPRYGISAAGLIHDGPAIRIDTPDGPSGIVTASVTPGYFQVLGVRPVRGRLFSDHDADAGRYVALLAHATWLTRFGGAEDVVGQTVTLGDTTLDVVGVLPRGVFLPMLFGQVPEVFTVRRFPAATDEKFGAAYPVVRLSRDVTREQAQTALMTMARASRPADSTALPVLEPARTVLFPAGQTIMRWLVTCTLMLVALAAVNLASLLLVRGFGRARETGVKLALGASRARIVRPVLFEVLGVSLASGVAAVVIARAAFEPLLAYVPQITYGNAAVGIDSRVAVMAVGVVAASAVLATVASVWFSMRRDADVLIRSAGRGWSSMVTWRRGRVLVGAQIALTVVLVFGAAITAKAFAALLNVPLGFDPENVARMSIQHRPGETLPYLRVFQRLEARPDVVAVGAVSQVPFDRGTPDEGAQSDDGARLGGISYALPGYFDALRLLVVRGRGLTWTDDREDRDVAVLTEAGARALAPDGEVLGRTFTNGSRNRTFRVVGVVADPRHSIEGGLEPIAYALPPPVHRPFTLMIRTTHRNDELLHALQQSVRDELPDLRIGTVWFSDSIRNVTAFRNPRFQTIVLSTLSSVALVLTMVGIVGVLGCLVAARTRELAVRAAIGATPASLVRLVIRQGLAPVAAGVVAGLVATRWASGFAEAQLFAVDTSGVGAIVMTVVAVLTAALVAAWIPSRRAGRIDPVVALRAE